MDSLCSSKLIYNQSLYFLRQAYFDCKKSEGKIVTPNYNQLYKLVKDCEIFKESPLDFVVKQSCIKQASNNWSSFIKASLAFQKTPSKFKSRPLIPRYLKKETNLITIDSSRLGSKGCKDSEIRIPKSDFRLKLPNYIDKNQIKCLRILNFYNKIKIEIVYEKETKKIDYNNGNTIGIDIGLNNLAAITSNEQSLSWLINGRPLKSINQYYNKKLARLRSIGATNQIEKLARKRKLKIDNYLHWASRQVINLCLEHKISKIVIGKNDGWKQDINLGRRNNQNFVQIPFAKFIQMIEYKAQEVGIEVILTEESYTSKCDHLACEEMKHQEKYLGKRTKRGQFKSSIGKILNADINGAIGILRKKKEISDAQILSLRNRGDVVSPKKLFKVS
jgi:putative transposase